MNNWLDHLKNRTHSEQSGFSLVELLVVVLIIGVLASIMVPRFISQRDSARNAQAIATMRNWENHIKSILVENDEDFTFAELTALPEPQPLQKFTLDTGVNLASQGDMDASPTGNFLPSGNKNNFKTIWIETAAPDPESGIDSKYGGITFCVGSQGTKNYCAAILGNAPTRRWTLSGPDNSLQDGNVGLTIYPGNAVTPATVDPPNVTNGTVSDGWKE